MKELYVEGLASHDGPESCAGACEGAGEALTGVRAGGAIEPRNVDVRGADAVSLSGRQHRRQRQRKLAADPAVAEPVHARNLQAREPGDPMAARTGDRRAGRSGKAEAVSLR